jgi:hypothetical protein
MSFGFYFFFFSKCQPFSSDPVCYSAPQATPLSKFVPVLSELNLQSGLKKTIILCCYLPFFKSLIRNFNWVNNYNTVHFPWNCLIHTRLFPANCTIGFTTTCFGPVKPRCNYLGINICGSINVQYFPSCCATWRIITVEQTGFWIISHISAVTCFKNG